MLNKITGKFKKRPLLYYAMSIAASWAGAGSLMNSTSLAQTIGIVPAMIWCLFNTLACMVFGLVIYALPTVRAVMRTKACRMVLALFSIFQIWLCMTAINEAWASTPLGTVCGMFLTYAFTAGFIVALYRHGIITNILTDNGGMYLIYVMVLILAVASAMMSGFDAGGLSFGLERENLAQGLYKGLLLLPGPFTYPYFFKLLDYNEANEDSVHKVNITAAFALGGVGFGIYLLFAIALIFTTISPALNICKAILLSVLAVSSLSSFVYSEFAVFGQRAGLGINLFALTFWIGVAPLGVMGVWTLMAESRVYIISVILIFSLLKRAIAARKGAAQV